jgi:hypothetical protein
MPNIFQFMPSASEGAVAGLRDFQTTLQTVDALDQRYRDVKERRNLEEDRKARAGATPSKPGVAIPLDAPNIEMLDTYQAPVQNAGVQPQVVPAKPTAAQMNQVTTNVDTVNAPNFTATNVNTAGLKGIPTDQLTKEQWASLPQPEKNARIQILNDQNRLKAGGLEAVKVPAAVGDVVAGPYNFGAEVLTRGANAVGIPRIGKALGVYGPDVTRVEVPKVLGGGPLPYLTATQESIDTLRKPVTEADVVAGLKGAKDVKTITGATGTTGAGTPTGGSPPGKAGLPSQVDEGQFNLVFDRLINVESGALQYDKNGNLTESSKGALGITQVMPATAKKPGYGVVPLKNQSKEEYIRFGRDYLTALLTKYNGDFQKALAAYNAGPGTIDKAIAKGGDKWLTLAPKESQNYVTKFAGLSGDGVPNQVAQNTVGTQPGLELISTANAGESAGVSTGKPSNMNTALNMSPRDFDIMNTYALNERQTTVDLYNRRRQDLIDRVNAANSAGNIARADEIMNQVDQLDLGINSTLKTIDNSLWRAQGDKASQEFMFTGNPARVQAVWSHYVGSQIQIQPRSDGMYNLYVNGQPAVDNNGQFIVRDRTSLAQDFYRSIDAEYRKQDQAFRADRAKFTYEKGIEAQANLSVKQLEVLGTINKAIIDGNYKLAEKQLDMNGFGSPALTTDGVAYVNKNGDVIVFRNNPPKLANGMTGEQVQYFPAPGAGLRKQ